MNCRLMGLFARDGKPPNFATKAFLGVAAGGIGSFVGTPAEISLIRMTADGRLLTVILVMVHNYLCSAIKFYIYIFDSW